MFYRLNRKFETRRFDREIAGILETKPLDICDAPWTIVSMVANRDVPMYLAAVKSFYMRIGGGKIVAIIDRDMPQNLRNTLSRHLPGIEFVILEEIETGSCQRGGTWERLLYCLDRSAHEYTIQLDSDTLTVADVPEVVGCLRANRAFTMTDGFARVSLDEAADQAQSTPDNQYIGVVSEARFSEYPGRENLHYIRGSSGFAGFAKGGFTRADIEVFHRHMAKLVGEERWREWGSEQCGSNFAIANSPNPLILSYPEYASFDHHVPRATAKFFHFIGRFRFAEGYFARRTKEVIAALTPGATPIAPPHGSITRSPSSGSLKLATCLTPQSLMKYGSSGLLHQEQPLELEIAERETLQKYPAGAPKFRLPGGRGRPAALQAARDVFASRIYASPVWLPEQRVKQIVDLGSGIGLSCLWWLGVYWRANVVAIEANPAFLNEIKANLALNNYASRGELASTRSTRVSDLLGFLEDRSIDILKVDLPEGYGDLLGDERFGALNLRSVVLRWQALPSAATGSQPWCVRRLKELGFRTYQTAQSDRWGMLWGYKT